ncbi:MAG: hypothetical protein KGL29_12075, partial [Alphaproteobacteria bacterium]|nr:hypothetical protein [Alphaproteobacteria bacterium]
MQMPSGVGLALYAYFRCGAHYSHRRTAKGAIRAVCRRLQDEDAAAQRPAESEMVMVLPSAVISVQVSPT